MPGDKQRPEDLWDRLTEAESGARSTLRQQLAAFDPAFRQCFAAGVQAPTLRGARHGERDIVLAALFLKRALSDLRAVWLLLTTGYTAQAASAAASLYENALAVVCLAGDVSAVAQIDATPSGDLPWSPKQLARILATRWCRGGAIGEADYERSWREVYAAYKWLCKIKHPTMRSAVHEAFAASVHKGEFIVVALPDVRLVDRPVKATIAVTALNRTREAIRAFVIALEPDVSGDFQVFVQRMDDVLTNTLSAFQQIATQPLAFTIGDTSIADEYAEIRQEGVDDSA